MKFDFIIPARMASSRFPGKVLKKLGDKVVVDWVYGNCHQSKYCHDVIIATDSPEVISHCELVGQKVALTRQHNCCSDRTAEVADRLSADWIVEVQGDEPFLWASLIDSWLDQAVSIIPKASQVDVFISVAPLSVEDAQNPNFVKMIINSKGRLLWASRSKIPSDSKGEPSKFFRHSGFYMWRKTSLLRFAGISPGPVERSEDTHALRLVENDFWAQAIILPETQAIDVPSDLDHAESFIRKNQVILSKELRVS